MGDTASDRQSSGVVAEPTTSGRPTPRMIWQALAITGGWVPLSIAAGQSVALRSDELGAPTAIYSLMVAGGWAVSMVSLPVMGGVADRAVRRGLDRRLLIIVGAIGMLACFGLLGIAGSLPLFALVWLLAQIPTSLIVTSASSRLANEAPASLRGWASTAAGLAPVVAITIGAITTLALSAVPSALFFAPAVVGTVLLIPSLILTPLPTPTPTDEGVAIGSARRFFPWTLLIAIALAFSGLAVGRIYLVPLIESVSTGSSDERITALASTTLLVATLGAVIGTVVSGRLLRSGRRSLSTFGWFSLASAVPLIALSLAASVSQVIAIGAVFGFVIGAINAAAYGIFLHRYSHRQDTARILGLIVGAETVPYVIVPLAAAVSQASADAALIPLLFAIGAALAMAASVLTFARLKR